MDDKFTSALRRLLGLLDNPEPGLASWHMACQNLWNEAKANAPDAPPSSKLPSPRNEP